MCGLFFLSPKFDLLTFFLSWSIQAAASFTQESSRIVSQIGGLYLIKINDTQWNCYRNGQKKTWPQKNCCRSNNWLIQVFIAYDHLFKLCSCWFWLRPCDCWIIILLIFFQWINRYTNNHFLKVHFHEYVNLNDSISMKFTPWIGKKYLFEQSWIDLGFFFLDKILTVKK